jgi:hypothetical protein
MAVWPRVFHQQSLSRSAGGFAKLPEGPPHLCGEIAVCFPVPAQMRMVEGGAIERCCKVAACGIAPISLAFRQFFAQCRHPAAEGTQEAPAQIGLFEHQTQHFPRMPTIVHLLLHCQENRVLQGCQWLAGLWRFGKMLRNTLSEVLHAEGEQLFLGTEIAEKRTPGDSRVAADLPYRRPVEANRGKQFPRCPFDLPKDELMFPLAKRPGILSFRPLFAASRANSFLHRVQIMAQSAVL